MHLLLHADNSAWQLAVQLTRPIDSGHLRMHASYPESHLLVHCSRDSCANRSLGVSVPASLDVTPDSHTRQTNAYLTTSSPIDTFEKLMSAFSYDTKAAEQVPALPENQCYGLDGRILWVSFTTKHSGIAEHAISFSTSRCARCVWQRARSWQRALPIISSRT